MTPPKLPRHYYPLFFAGLLLVMVVAAAIAVALDLNPYVAMTVAGGVWVLRETWILRRRGY